MENMTVQEALKKLTNMSTETNIWFLEEPVQILIDRLIEAEQGFRSGRDT